MNRYRVTFRKTLGGLPSRVFFVAAENRAEAFEIARAIEPMLELPETKRERSLEAAIVEAVTGDEDASEEDRCAVDPHDDRRCALPPHGRELAHRHREDYSP